MIPITPELVDAHRQDLLIEAADRRRGRGDVPARPRRRIGRWSAHRVA